MSTRVVWAGMSKDIAAWCRECQACQRSKVTRQPVADVQPIAVPSQRFSHVHVDLVGPLPTSRHGMRFLFTMIDRASRWVEAVPLRAMDTATCVEAFISTWVTRFGVPALLTSDQGRQFVSAAWQRLCSELGIRHITTTAYHPQANGMIERVHRQLKDCLKARLAGPDWPDHLPWVLLGLRSTPRDADARSSAELVYGAQLTLPAQLAADQEMPLADFLPSLLEFSPPPVRHGGQVPPDKPPAALSSVEWVYVRRGGALPPLMPPYAGPYRVLHRTPKFFRVLVGSQEQLISVDRLKPHQGVEPVEPAPPPGRSRPGRRVSASLSYAAVVAGGGPCSGSGAAPVKKCAN
jgi:transposase InsO family protein